MTTSMDEYRDLNIVILGASFGGISAVHHVYKYAIPELRRSSRNFSYRITLVSPSTHLYWNISAPRAIVSAELISHAQSFIPLETGFQDFDPRRFEFIQGTATDLDTKSCSVTVRCPVTDPKVRPNSELYARERHERLQDKMGGTALRNSYSKYPNGVDISEPASQRARKFQKFSERVIRYHALIIATGSTANSPLLSLRGPHENTRAAIDTFQAKLSVATTVIIAGGGSSGVEVAGQIAYWYNQRRSPDKVKKSSLHVMRHLLKSGSGPTAKSIVLICGSNRLLPKLNEKLGLQAERQLKQLGVQIMMGIRVEGVSDETETGRTIVKLSNWTHLLCDCYVPCTGVLPNTQFLPFDTPLVRDGFMATCVDQSGSSTLRVNVPDVLLPDNAVKVNRAEASNSRRKSKDPNDDITLQTIALSRVYAIGDCADYSNQCVLDISASIEVLKQNLILDLMAYQLAVINPYGGNQDTILALYERSVSYKRNPKTSQLIPIGGYKPGGVGVLQGHILPSLAVYLLKGRDYAMDKGELLVRQGVDPYPGHNAARPAR